MQINQHVATKTNPVIYDAVMDVLDVPQHHMLTWSTFVETEYQLYW